MIKKASDLYVCVLKMYTVLVSGNHEGKSVCVCVCVEDVPSYGIWLS